MEVFTSNDAKQNFGELSDKALQGPVSITKHGRPALVLTSDQDYKEYLRLKHAMLKAEVQAGFESLDRGDSVTLKDEGELSAFMEDIKRRGHDRLKHKAQ